MSNEKCDICKKVGSIAFQDKNTLEKMCVSCLDKFKQKQSFTRMVVKKESK